MSSSKKVRGQLPRLVLGLDPAKAAGAALFLDGKLVGHAEADGSTWTSLVSVLRRMCDQYADVPINARIAVIETGWTVGRNAKALHTLALRRGIAQSAAEAVGFHSLEYIYPSTWQNALFGPLAGRDTKALSKRFALDRYGVTVEDNAADAIALAAYYSQTCTNG